MNLMNVIPAAGQTLGIAGVPIMKFRNAPTVAFIQMTVAHHYGLSAREMTSERRSREIAWPRQIAMYLAYKLTPKSLPGIGRQFNRDHTTILHGIRCVRRRIASDQSYRETVEMLRQRIEAHATVEIVRSNTFDSKLVGA
jgi:hypothetical protein